MSITRTVSCTMAAATLALTMMADPADASSRRRGMSPGAAAAVGIMGGIAAGALIAGAAQGAVPAPRPYYAPAPVYVQPEPVYVRPRPRVVVEETCRTERIREWVPGYGWQETRRTICD